MNIKGKQGSEFAVCVDSKGYETSLEAGKLYRVIPDNEAASHGYIRVIDESGEDYGFSASRFFPIEVPQALEKALTSASEFLTENLLESALRAAVGRSSTGLCRESQKRNLTRPIVCRVLSSVIQLVTGYASLVSYELTEAIPISDSSEVNRDRAASVPLTRLLSGSDRSCGNSPAIQPQPLSKPPLALHRAPSRRTYRRRNRRPRTA